MIFNQIKVGTNNITLNCLNQTDNFTEITWQEISGKNMLPLKPIIYKILSIKNKSLAQSNFDYMRITMTEGKNRLKEQFEDSNLLKNSIIQSQFDGDKFLIGKIVAIISNETNLDYKKIQCIEMLLNNLAIEYQNLFILNEEYDVSLYNKLCNVLLVKAINYINKYNLLRVDSLVQEYLNNPVVSDNMKDHLKYVGVKFIENSVNTSFIYENFKRKAKMDQAQKIVFSNFVLKVRANSKEYVPTKDLCDIFHIKLDIYESNKFEALEPIDDLLDSIIQYGDTPDIEVDY